METEKETEWKDAFVDSYFSYCRKNKKHPGWWWSTDMRRELAQCVYPQDFSAEVQELVILQWLKVNPLFVCEGIRQGAFGQLEQPMLKFIVEKITEKNEKLVPSYFQMDDEFFIQCLKTE